jgi:thiamine biosynthesis lipoprotein
VTAAAATRSWEALGTTALIRVDDPAALQDAAAILSRELAAIDLAASRFRPDSELARVNRGAGRFTPLSPLLWEAIAVALRAAHDTGGAVDPALGEAIRVLGYGRDFSELEPGGRDDTDPAQAGRPRAPALIARRLRGWEQIGLSADPPGVTIPVGMELDLGATAKALCADRAAAAAARATGAGVLVSLGGDIAIAGRAPAEGWAIHVTDDHRSDPRAPGQTIAIGSGGLATSSTTTRRWRHEGRVMHHILDPRTGAPAAGPYRTVSVAAADCVRANTASTAAIVLGDEAPAWLNERGLPARLVARDGNVTVLGRWPAEPAG